MIIFVIVAKLQRKIGLGKNLSVKTVGFTRSNVRFVECRAEYDLEIEGVEVGLVYFAEAYGVGSEAFASLDFDVIAYGTLSAKTSSPYCQP